LVLIFSPFQKTWGQDTGFELKVVADQANIRLEPDISSIIIRQVPKGTILNAIEKRNDWFKVEIKTQQGALVTGYVHDSLVSKIESSPGEKNPPRIEKLRPIKPAQTEEEQEKPSRFYLSIMGGGNYIHGGDLNLGIDGLAGLYEDTLRIKGEGNIGSVHWGYVLGLEVSFPLSENLFWGIGADHFRAKNQSQVEYPQGSFSSYLIIKPNLFVTPVNLFLVFYPLPDLYVKGGISTFFAHFAYDYQFQRENLTEQWEGKTNAMGLGVSGSLGLSKKYSSHLSLFAEISGRLAKIQGFEGKGNFQDSTGSDSSQQGFLYLIQTQILEDRTHPVLFIRDTKPNEAGIIAAHKAQVDLSGFGVKIGLRFHF
jgi:hypothetical protein